MDRPDLHENEGRRNARRNNIAAIALAAPRYAGSAAPQVPRPPPGRRRTTARAADRPAPARVLGRTAASPLSEFGAFAVETAPISQAEWHVFAASPTCPGISTPSAYPTPAARTSSAPARPHCPGVRRDSDRARDRFEPHRNLHSAHSGPKPRLPHAEPDRARQDRSAGTRRLTRNRAHAPYRPHDPTPIPPSTVRTRGSPRQDGESPRTLPLERTQERNREPYGALRAHRRPLDLDQGRCRHRAARGRRNPRTGEAVSIPARTAPPFKAGKTLCGRLDGQHGERAVRWHPFGCEPQPGRPRFFATHPPRRDAPDSPLPSRILRHRRPSRSHAHCATAITLPPPSGCRLPPGRGTFVAGRRRGDFVDRSYVRTHAQSRADLESSRARVPHIGRWEFRATPPLRAGAHIQYWQCCRCAYAGPRSASGPPRRGVHDKGATRVREPRDHFRSTPSSATPTAHWQNRTGHLRLRDIWASRRTMRRLQRPWRYDQ